MKINFYKTKIMICLVILIGMMVIIPYAISTKTEESNILQKEGIMDGYKIINLFSFNFVNGFIHILPGLLAPYGVVTDIVAPVATIADSMGDPYSDIDYLCSEINVAEYDILWLPGEWGTDNLTLYSSAVDLITDAYTEGLILVAYNYGPIAFANVDIINGKNITGHETIESAIEAAGGNYIPDTEGICVDIPFITAAWGYDEDLEIEVALALGFDLLATESPTPTIDARLSLSGLILVICITLTSFHYKKKNH